MTNDLEMASKWTRHYCLCNDFWTVP